MHLAGVRFFFLLLSFSLLSPILSASAQESKSIAQLSKELAEKYKDRQPILWGEHLSGITDIVAPSETAPENFSPPARVLALTLDACAGGTDERIIALLREYHVPVTIFVTNRWLNRNKTVADNLAKDPLFLMACHGKRHKPASVNGKQVYGIDGTSNIPALVEEVEENVRAVTALTGVRPTWFRSGTAYYDDVAVDVIRDLGLSIAGYTVTGDKGASLPPKEVAQNLLNAPNRAIILCHMNHPESGTFEGLALAIPELLRQGTLFVTLGKMR